MLHLDPIVVTPMVYNKVFRAYKDICDVYFLAINSSTNNSSPFSVSFLLKFEFQLSYI